MLARTTSGGIFVGVRVAPESRALIRNYVATLNLPADVKPLPPSQYHVTVIYSKQPLPIDYPLDTTPSVARVYDVRYIGAAVALIVESRWLRWRNRVARICGYSSEFSGVSPHLSLLYEPPPGLPVAFWKKPDFFINLAGEYQDSVKD